MLVSRSAMCARGAKIGCRRCRCMLFFCHNIAFLGPLRRLLSLDLALSLCQCANSIFFHPTIRMNFTFHRLVWKRLDAGVKNDYVTKIPEKMLQSIFDSLDGRNLPIFNAYSLSEYAFTVSPTRPPTCKILLFPHSCG